MWKEKSSNIQVMMRLGLVVTKWTKRKFVSPEFWGLQLMK
jgi:hypothetical protein